MAGYKLEKSQGEFTGAEFWDLFSPINHRNQSQVVGHEGVGGNILRKTMLSAALA